jgi:hypothetical protein
MPKTKDMDIDVFITKDGSPPDGFTFGFGPDKKNSLDFKNEKHPGVMCYFNIDPNSNAGLSFQPDPANALQVDNPPGGKQLVPLSVEQDGKQLIAYCRNLNVEQYKFTLGFVDKDGKAVPWDPIGNDNNGLRS